MQPTNFNHCLSSTQKLDGNVVLNAQCQDITYSEQSETTIENQVESITVSRTPPWRKNSILNQQQQQQQSSSVTAPNVENANGRVPPITNQHVMQTQPPWQDETHKRNNSKKQPNFKEDPTGYLDQQTAILHSSILNVHSPELQDNESNSLITYRPQTQQIQIATKQTSRSATDTPTHQNNQKVHINATDTNDPSDHQQMSVMQQQNQNMYIQQQFDSNGPKQMIIGSNGQPVRIIQNSPQIVYSSATGGYQLNQSTTNQSQLSQPLIGTISNRNHNLINAQTVQLHEQHKQQSHQNHHHHHPHNHHPHQQQQRQESQTQQQFSSHPQLMGQHQSQQLHTQSVTIIDQIPKLITTHQQIDMTQTDQRHDLTNKNNTDNNDDSISLPIGVTHLPNGLVQVHHNCDINQVKNQHQIQPQTIVLKSSQSSQNLNQTKLKDHQYVLSQKPSILARVVSVSQESPVSSSTANKNALIEAQSSDDKGPPQVGAISTSNESPPIASPVPSESPELTIKTKGSYANYSSKLQSGIYVAGQTSAKNTITSVLAGKAMTSTTSTSHSTLSNEKIENIIQIHENRILKPVQTMHISNKQQNVPFTNQNTNITVKSGNRTVQAVVTDNSLSSTTQSNLSGLQIQQQPTNQIIMTSSGQILVMSAQNNKNSNPMIIGNPANSNALVLNNAAGQQNMVLNAQNTHTIIGNELMQGMNENHSVANAQSNIIQGANNSMVNVISGNQNIMQSSNSVIAANNGNVISNNSSNYIVSSPNAIQPMIINNSNLLSHNGNVLHQTNANNLIATANATKVLSNLSPPNILTNQSNVITANNQFISNNNSGALLSPNNGGIVLNQLSNTSYVIQPQSFTTVDGQVVNVINSDNGNQYVQQTQQRIILSPDSKRRIKKRKSNSASPQTDSPQQSPTMQTTPSQQTTVLQIAPQYQSQFQISPGGTGITLVQNKPTINSPPQQQILLQNGQTLLQPLNLNNLIGQQLLVPAGLMMAPDTTLLQISPCGSLITPQGMVIRSAQSPQNKSFLSPNSANQQFILSSGNGQISPMYSYVVPQSQSSTPTFVQQSTTIVQQQTTMMNQSDNDLTANIPQSVSTQTAQTSTLQTVAASPPDTTTHSPRSPERPDSQRSGGSDINMVFIFGVLTNHRHLIPVILIIQISHQ